MACGKKACSTKKEKCNKTNTVSKQNDAKSMISVEDELKSLKVGETKVFNKIDNKTEHGFEKGYQRLTRTKNGYVYSYSYESEENLEEPEEE